MVALFLGCFILMIEWLKKGSLHYAHARIARRKEILKRKWSGREDSVRDGTIRQGAAMRKVVSF